jgi:hypothetical protein
MNIMSNIKELKDTLNFPEGKYTNEQLETILSSVNESISNSNDKTNELFPEKQLIATYESLMNITNIYTIKSRFSDVYIVSHDGVPYAFDDLGNINNKEEPEKVLRTRIENSIKDRNVIIERHHEIIKQTYDYCKNLNIGEIWCMVGGGSNYSIYFGNDTGYLAELHLSPKTRRSYRTRQPKYLFLPNWEHHDKYFENKFHVDGIKFRTNKKHWANT